MRTHKITLLLFLLLPLVCAAQTYEDELRDGPDQLVYKYGVWIGLVVSLLTRSFSSPPTFWKRFRVVFVVMLFLCVGSAIGLAPATTQFAIGSAIGGAAGSALFGVGVHVLAEWIIRKVRGKPNEQSNA